MKESGTKIGWEVYHYSVLLFLVCNGTEILMFIIENREEKAGGHKSLYLIEHSIGCSLMRKQPCIIFTYQQLLAEKIYQTVPQSKYSQVHWN